MEKDKIYSGTSPLEHLYSVDTNLVPKESWDIIFAFALEGTPLFRGKGRSFSGSRNPILTFFQGTACYSKSYWPQKKVDKLDCSPVKLATTFKIWTIFRSNQCIKLVAIQHTTSRRSLHKLNHDFLIIIWPL